MPMPQLTNHDAMQRYLSLYGLVSFSDHDADGVEDDGVVEGCIEFACGKITGKLVQRYQPQYLANSPVLCEYATVVALRTLCMRRGNPVPESLEARYHEIMDKDGELDQIANGTEKVVDGNGDPLPGKASYAPSHSNLVVNRLFEQNTIRVESNSSSQVDSKLPRDIQHRSFNGQ